MMAVVLAHALPSMVPVVRSAMEAGIAVTFIGKPYSTIQVAADEMRDIGAVVHTPEFGGMGYMVHDMRHFVNSLPIPKTARLFDSGGILKSIHGRGNQLTSHGASHHSDIGLNPIKRATEAPFIAEAIASQIPHAGKRVMVIGDGIIATAIKRLMETLVDERPEIIIGATGFDVSEQVVRHLSGPVDLFSASSWDVEFNKLLRNGHPNAIIHNRGCPINFNRSEELEPAYGMRETRAALLRAILAPDAD